MSEDPVFLKRLRRAAEIYRDKWGDEPAKFGGKAFTIDEVVENIEQDTEDGRMIVQILSERMKPSTLEQAVDKVFSDLEYTIRKLFGRE